jgi:hypothetical protein
VAGVRRKMTLPDVDLPQPDSPTTPRVSPSAIENVTSSTARIRFRVRRKTPPLTGKCFFRFRTCKSACPVSVLFDPFDPINNVPLKARSLPLRSHETASIARCPFRNRKPPDFEKRRFLGPAAVFAERAAIGKFAPRRYLRRRVHYDGNVIFPRHLQSFPKTKGSGGQPASRRHEKVIKGSAVSPMILPRESLAVQGLPRVISFH